MKNPLKIAILHYRIGKTDGVSLEITKHKKVLEKLGHKVILISGPKQTGVDHIIPELEFDTPSTIKLKENAFFKFKDYKSEYDLIKDILELADTIKHKFLKIHKKENVDTLFVHNIFTHARHIACAKAFYEIAEEIDIKVIGFNHDFYWVGAYKDIYKPTNNLIKKYLDSFVPPKTKNISHAVINSINQAAFYKKTKIKPTVVPNVFDFSQPVWKKDISKNDIFVLQATRISARKGIEMAIDLVGALNKKKKKLIGKTLYNGKKITPESDIILVLAGYAEKDSLDYKKALKEKAKKAGVTTKFIAEKITSLWRAYETADLVTFPSLWEGWGNQFIEAIFAKKPIALFEYPVYKSDIKPAGYKAISFGQKIVKRDKNKLIVKTDKKINRVADETISWLTSKNTNKIIKQNFEVGKNNHSLRALRKILANMLK